MKTDKREFWLDFIRSIAILAVILNHSVEFICNLNTSEGFYDIPEKARTFSVALFLIGRISGVPLFLFLSGYLLLNKQIIDDTKLLAFYKHNLLGILITSEIWMLILYPLIRYLDAGYDIQDLIYAMLMWKQVPYMQFWYIPFIVGVYIGIPFLSLCVAMYSERIIKFIWILCFFIFVVINTLRFFNGISIAYPVQMDTSLFMGGIAFLYLTYGYYIGSKKLSESTYYPVIVISIVFLYISSIILQLYYYSSNMDAKIGYDILPTFVCSCLLFVLLRDLGKTIQYAINENKGRESKLKTRLELVFLGAVTEMSQLSFGAYFVHAPIQDIIRRMRCSMLLGEYEVKYLCYF